MRIINFDSIIKSAWEEYAPNRPIVAVDDYSPKVSTNYVYRVMLENDECVFAKLSYFGKYSHFKKDHTIINNLANNLPAPYDNFLSRSMTTEDGEVYVYRFMDSIMDVWVVFYQPIEIDQKLPRKLEEFQIKKLGSELAKFHKVSGEVINQIPTESKTLADDINHLLEILKTDTGQYEHRMYIDLIKEQCDLFLSNMDKIGAESFNVYPVFTDWNIGNFSVNQKGEFYSRWDYDWFRVSSRVMDFYFFSRVTSSIGDKTVFSYVTDPLEEDRFMLFLKEYHKVFPLTREEVLFIKEAYRFFLLNYVVKDGRYFFHEIYAYRLRQEAYEVYFPQLEKYSVDKILKALDL